MIYIIYAAVALGIILLSKKVSEYVDLIEKTTSLSGAFVGGIMLSAVTSLPELFTSISSTLFLNKPGLCIGNILGSNLFNMSMLGILIIIFIGRFNRAELSNSHKGVTLCVLMVYLVIALNIWQWYSLEIFTVSVTSLIILILYGFSVKNMSRDNGDAVDEAVESPWTLRQLMIRFVVLSLFIIGLSIWITYITDEISIRLNLGAGLAGAIFLGIATSLPEVSSSIALFRMKSYDIAIGNIIGSNIFNFLILAITDIVYTGGGIYDFSDHKTFNLLVFGSVAAALLLLLLSLKNKVLRFISALVMVACYVLFLVA